MPFGESCQTDACPTRVVWLYGLPGAGKSTLADALACRLYDRTSQLARLDGDELRRGLCADLGFGAEDRAENLRRVAHVARLMSDANLFVVCSFITPLEADRRLVRSILGDRMLDVFVDASLATCEARDPKGHYRRARAGEIPSFTGVSSPFERPAHPGLSLDSEHGSVPALVGRIVERLEPLLSASR